MDDIELLGEAYDTLNLARLKLDAMAARLRYGPSLSCVYIDEAIDKLKDAKAFIGRVGEQDQ